MMLDVRANSKENIQALPDLNRYDFFYGDKEEEEFIQMRGYYAPVGISTIRIDDSLSDMGPVGVVFSNKPIQHSTNKLKVLNCNGSDLFSFEEFPVGTVLATESFGTNYFAKSFGVISVPVGTAVIKVSKPPDAPPQTVWCSGGGRISFSITENPREQSLFDFG
jgi:hypothetical protein